MKPGSIIPEDLGMKSKELHRIDAIVQAGLAAGAALTVATESSNLNLRQEPNTEASVVGKAAKGESVTLVEQTSDDWWKVKTADGEEGYAYARYLQV